MMLPLLLGLAVATAASTKRKPDVERGAELYALNCWMCHGKRALGDGPARTVLGPEAPALAGRVPAETWPAHTELILNGAGAMPGFASLLGEEEARVILLWLGRLDPETGKDPEGEKRPPKPPAKKDRSKPPAAKAPDLPEQPADPADPADPAQPPEPADRSAAAPADDPPL